MEGTSAAPAKGKKEQMEERMKKLRQLHNARNEARAQNHKEVVAEDARNKLPSNWESRRQQAEWMVNDEKAREEAKAKGLDYDRVKLLNITAADAEKSEKQRRNKSNPDVGFSDYEAQTARQYNRLVKNMAPRDMERYEAERRRLGEAFYGGPNTVLHGLQRDTPAAIDNMVKDLDQQIEKRKKFSRRRMHNDDADIDFINEKNARFNKKLERFYGEHTAEIKQNLERGTAI